MLNISLIRSGEQMDQTLWSWHPLCCWGTPQKSHTAVRPAASGHPHPWAAAGGACQSPQWRQNTEAETTRAETERKWDPLRRPVPSWTVSTGFWRTWAESCPGPAVCGFSSSCNHQREPWDQKSEDEGFASIGACVCWRTVLHSDWCGATAMHSSVPGKSFPLGDMNVIYVRVPLELNPHWAEPILLMSYCSIGIHQCTLNNHFFSLLLHNYILVLFAYQDPFILVINGSSRTFLTWSRLYFKTSLLFTTSQKRMVIHKQNPFLLSKGCFSHIITIRASVLLQCCSCMCSLNF